jgi:hypothetical protein
MYCRGKEMLIDLNKDVPITPFQDMFLKSTVLESDLRDIYINMINVIRDRNYVRKDMRNKAESYEKISRAIGSKFCIINAIKNSKRTGNIDALKRIVAKLIEAKL